MIAAIARHESTSLLRAAQTWLIAALMAAIIGYWFLKQLEVFISVQSQLALQDNPVGLSGYLGVRYLEPLALLFTIVAALFSMRSFSDEYRYHTYALWQSSPVSTTSLVAGKFLGIYCVLSALVALSVVMVASLRLVVPLDIPVLLSAMLGLLLCTGACTAVGLFFSSMTQHSLIAIIASLGLLLMLWLIGSSTAGEFSMQWLSHLSIAAHLHGFFQGYLNSADIIYFLLMILLFLGLTIIRLDLLRQNG